MAAQYHTVRFRLVPQLAKALSVPAPPLRRPGSAWTELPRPPGADAVPAGHVRIGYGGGRNTPEWGRGLMAGSGARRGRRPGSTGVGPARVAVDAS